MTLIDYTTMSILLFCLIAIPGPNFLIISTMALQQGRMKGLLCSIGVATGYLILTTLAVMGIGIVVAASSYAQLLMKLIGSGYFCYLAWQVWHSSINPSVLDVTVTMGQSRVSFCQSYLKGLITDLTNPSSIVFFSTVFLSVSKPGLSRTDSICLVVLSTVLALGWYGFVAWSLSWLTFKRLYAHSKTGFDRLAAAIFAGFAFQLWSS